jgi:Spy/CpxP family protein refolding chaperone
MRATFKTLAPCKSLAPVFFVVFGLALGTNARAQTQGAPTAQPTPARRGGVERPARGGNLMRRLNLTPEQRLKLREIRSQGEPETRVLTRRVRLARRALDEAIYSDAVEDALVEQRARELAAAQTALVRLRAATELKVRRVLTAEQLQTFRELRRQAQRRQSLRRQLRNAGRQSRPNAPVPETDDPPLE